MQIGLCCPPDALNDAPEGLEFLEPTVGWLLVPDQGPDAFAEQRRLADAAAVPCLAVNCLFPQEIPTTGPSLDLGKVEQFFSTVAQRAGEAGVEHIVFGSGGSRTVPAGFPHADAAEQLVQVLALCGPIAQAAGVTLVLEPLQKRECNIATSVDEAADYVRRADHPAVRLLVDTYHMTSDDEGPESIGRAGGLIAHVHCADRQHRAPLGIGSADHRPWFRALKDIGYDGKVSIEAKWTDRDAQLPDAVAALREQIDTA
jgi:sugar phosphate isomerase/epimerase